MVPVRDASVTIKWLLAIGLCLATILAVAVAVVIEEEEEETAVSSQVVEAIQATTAVLQTLRDESRKRSRSSSDECASEEGRPQKKRYIRYDRERAQTCVRQDYVGPSPLFDDKQFERVFRITRTIYERVRRICCEDDSFFRRSSLLVVPGRDLLRGKSLHVKILKGLLACFKENFTSLDTPFRSGTWVQFKRL